MKITKLVHSCLLIEDGGKIAIIDPGQWSAQSGLLNLDFLTRIDYILVTHAHIDHCDPLFIESIRDHSPESLIISNQTVIDELAKHGIHGAVSGPSEIHMATTTHAVFQSGQEATENTIITLWNKLTHMGDSLHLVRPAPILALPITAPWGSLGMALDVAVQMQPQYVIPIHDWHLSDEGKVWYYQKAEEILAPKGIKFMPLSDGNTIEINV